MKTNLKVRNVSSGGWLTLEVRDSVASNNDVTIELTGKEHGSSAVMLWRHDLPMLIRILETFCARKEEKTWP